MPSLDLLSHRLGLLNLQQNGEPYGDVQAIEVYRAHADVVGKCLLRGPAIMHHDGGHSL